MKHSSFLFIFIYMSFSAFSSDYLDVGTSHQYQMPWMKLAKNENQALLILFNTLSQSKTGKNILAKASSHAAQRGLLLTDIIIPGDGSLTDTTLVRKFSPHDPNTVTYESRSKVYINRNLNLLDALLDLAHELTHYLYRTPFNPYSSQFGPKEFIQNTIEGRGGEVDAYLVECQVYNEIFHSFKSNQSRCSLVVDPSTGKLSKERGIEQFYRVGDYYKKLQDDLRPFFEAKSELPHLSEQTAIFISSAYGLPYPVAALSEFQTIMNKACQNDLKRIKLAQENHDQMNRQVASQATQQLWVSYQGRCNHFTQSSVQ